MMNRRALGIALAGAGLAGCAATAQPNMAPQGMAAAPPPSSGGPGAGLRMQALQGGAFLMQTAQLGASKAQRADLRRFAPFEVTEQQGLVQAMGLLHGNMAPPPPSADKAAMLQQLQAANGRQFDRLFVTAQVQGHQEAMATYTSIAQDVAAPAADRAIALLAVDRIREHLTFLQAIAPRA
ncbi:DUF4142 domain-containing protein [Roseomonas sp. SSH11]|uniref:DUF4142 domain-containing protein n=1 Tax=Pararoseomonas baculiformis TaxID=2820812 RepID=A0ABS4AAU7_9PROT|nr:DUF4142 domain-containing protein [Pararoseomonas baculiformis]MBP0444127.1 DUF4142 domain-containing protein [Pararoseomonas baculiformis]